ncbi:hypothetical protein GCM10007916_31530 [Psychromonas marina]|uniref:YkgJ family cysteine cluster protein n=1 Tax=Psychromonas marina TaxID=88364 RepID=A0ABQ6E4H7_9GAMM|nr:hypothetical protein [Psychromonas marina]GLS92083.1 hypothetical protein GCM10007916_31530 [Psychromonas marina]
MSEDNESHLVSGRECGECTACCVVLLIDDEQFKKPADQVCTNLMAAGGCKIYQQRPSVCQAWYCAWRFMAQLDESWRPDRSGILLRSDENGIIFQPIRDPKTVLTTDRAIELIGGGVAQGIPMSMSIPTREGYLSYGLSLNGPLAAAVESRNLVIIQEKMVELIDFSIAQQTSRIDVVLK